MPDTVQDRRETLIEYGYLDLDDLQINHQGLLANSQIVRLYAYNSYWFIAIFANIIFFLFLVWQQINTQRLTEAFIFWLVLLSATTFYSIMNLQNIVADVKLGEVKKISGRIFKYHTVTSSPYGGRGSRFAYCTVRVQDLVFTINPALYDVLEDQQCYRLYFSPRTKHLVNIEPY